MGPGDAGFLTRFREKFLFLENPKYLQHLLLVPVLIFFIVWNVIPLLWLVGLSFYKYVLVTGEPLKFIGLTNFKEIFGSFEIWHALSNTFFFVIIGTLSQTVLGIILGFLFWDSKDLPGRRFALTLIFTPMILAPLATGSFFKLIYDPVFGIVNYFLKSIAGVTIDFLGSTAWALPSVLIVDTWMWTPFMMMMTLAALGSVPKAELEAAEVENLSWYRRLVHVVLPHGKFILMLGILLRTIDAFKSMDIIFTMTGGGPGNATELIGITLYRQAFNAFTMGKASALAIIALLIAISFTSIYLYILQKKEESM
ncbi:MAG: sugar ABC transporter permease [Deltaproteobacteria bacterium]|nr:sugar ABC transporter permease [Deltaproteobacteria bacterium]